MSRETYQLSDAYGLGYLLRVRCGACGVAHHYNANDLIRIVGDLPVCFLEERMTCERCRTREYVRVTQVRPSAAELERIKIRRLVGVKWERKLVWKDEQI